MNPSRSRPSGGSKRSGRGGGGRSGRRQRDPRSLKPSAQADSWNDETFGNVNIGAADWETSHAAGVDMMAKFRREQQAIERGEPLPPAGAIPSPKDHGSNDSSEAEGGSFFGFATTLPPGLGEGERGSELSSLMSGIRSADSSAPSDVWDLPPDVKSSSKDTQSQFPTQRGGLGRPPGLQPPPGLGGDDSSSSQQSSPSPAPSHPGDDESMATGTTPSFSDGIWDSPTASADTPSSSEGAKSSIWDIAGLKEAMMETSPPSGGHGQSPKVDATGPQPAQVSPPVTSSTHNDDSAALSALLGGLSVGHAGTQAPPPHFNAAPTGPTSSADGGGMPPPHVRHRPPPGTPARHVGVLTAADLEAQMRRARPTPPVAMDQQRGAPPAHPHQRYPPSHHPAAHPAHMVGRHPAHHLPTAAPSYHRGGYGGGDPRISAYPDGRVAGNPPPPPSWGRPHPHHAAAHPPPSYAGGRRTVPGVRSAAELEAHMRAAAHNPSAAAPMRPMQTPPPSPMGAAPPVVHRGAVSLADLEAQLTRGGATAPNDHPSKQHHRPPPHHHHDGGGAMAHGGGNHVAPSNPSPPTATPSSSSSSRHPHHIPPHPAQSRHPAATASHHEARGDDRRGPPPRPQRPPNKQLHSPRNNNGGGGPLFDDDIPQWVEDHPVKRVNKKRWKRDKRRMTADDINSIIKMLYFQMQSNAPFRDDFYYQSCLQLQEDRMDVQRGRPLDACEFHIPLFQVMPEAVRPAKSKDPFEGCLGRIPFHSWRVPRPLLALQKGAPASVAALRRQQELEKSTASVTAHESSPASSLDGDIRKAESSIGSDGSGDDSIGRTHAPSSSGDQGDYNGLLLSLEDLIARVVTIEDADTLLRRGQLSRDGKDKRYILQARRRLGDGLFRALRVYVVPFEVAGALFRGTSEVDDARSSMMEEHAFPQDRFLVNVCTVDKGLRVVARALRVMQPNQAFFTIMALMRNLCSIISNAMASGTHQRMRRLFGLCGDMLRAIDSFQLAQVIFCVQAFMTHQQVDQQVSAAKTKPGMSLLAALFRRGHEIRIAAARRAAAAAANGGGPPRNDPAIPLWEETFYAFVDRLEDYFPSLLQDLPPSPAAPSSPSNQHGAAEGDGAPPRHSLSASASSLSSASSSSSVISSTGLGDRGGRQAMGAASGGGSGGAASLLGARERLLACARDVWEFLLLLSVHMRPEQKSRLSSLLTEEMGSCHHRDEDVVKALARALEQRNHHRLEEGRRTVAS